MPNQSSMTDWAYRDILFDGDVGILDTDEGKVPKEIYRGSPDGDERNVYRIVAWGYHSHPSIARSLMCRLAFERFGSDAMGEARWRPLGDADTVKPEDLISCAVGRLIEVTR